MSTIAASESPVNRALHVKQSILVECAILVLLTLLLWGDFFFWIQTEWDLNPNYGVGYFVPFGALFLAFAKRDEWLHPNPPVRAPWALAVAIASMLTVGGVNLIAEVNPDWRKLMWLQAILLSFFSLSTLYRTGGWPWVRTGLIPVLYLFLAIPWPSDVESVVVAILMPLAAERAADLLTLLGYDVVVRGNLVGVNGTLLGVDEACSGLKSLLATLMVWALLVLWRPIGMARSGILFVYSLGLCVILNVARVVTLGWIGAEGGKEAIRAAHDLVGACTTLGIFGGVFLGFWILSPVSVQPTVRSSPPDRRILGNLRPWGIGIGLMLIALWTLQKVTVWGYYHEGEHTAIGNGRLNWDWNAAAPQLKQLAISEEVASQLRFSTAERCLVGLPSRGITLQLFTFDWHDGRLSSFTSVHRPTNCLPAIGYQLVWKGDVTSWYDSGRNISIHPYVFRLGPTEYHVFHAMWDVRSGRDVLAEGGLVDRFGPVIARQAFGATQAILFVVQGAGDLGDAELAVRDLLSDASVVK